MVSCLYVMMTFVRPKDQESCQKIPHHRYLNGLNDENIILIQDEILSKIIQHLKSKGEEEMDIVELAIRIKQGKAFYDNEVLKVFNEKQLMNKFEKWECLVRYFTMANYKHEHSHALSYPQLKDKNSNKLKKQQLTFQQWQYTIFNIQQMSKKIGLTQRHLLLDYT